MIIVTTTYDQKCGVYGHTGMIGLLRLTLKKKNDYLVLSSTKHLPVDIDRWWAPGVQGPSPSARSDIGPPA